MKAPRQWTRIFAVGRYTVEMSYRYGAGTVYCRWLPTTPPPGSLGNEEMAQYRAGRDALMAQAAKDLGGTFKVIET